MEKLNKILTYLLFLCLIIIGLLTYKEIGISWDEPEQREMGLMFYNYIFNNDTGIYENYHQYYGALIEFPLVLIEKAFNLESSREIYLSRHLALHLFFIISFFRWHPYDFPYKNKVFTLKTKGSEYMSVYKLK